jgi:hypothetical protein
MITIAGVLACNRVNKLSTGMARQFVVTATAGVGSTTIGVYPSLIPQQGGQNVQYQTVIASPANNATISAYVLPSVTFRRNFAYAPQMITMATGDLPLPEGVEQKARHRYDNVSMRSVTQYAIGTDQSITRLDVLFGALPVRPEWGCIVADAV